MSDFYLDLRPADSRNVSQVRDHLRSLHRSKVVEWDGPRFSLLLSRGDDPVVWAPYRCDAAQVTVALSGRIALEPHEWETARAVNGSGGLACKAVFQSYRENGLGGLTSLNGNFTVLVCDETEGRVFIVTDRCGAAPAFQSDDPQKLPVFSSHPDLLAAAIGVSDGLDFTSLREFLSTGKVSFPSTYYDRVKGINCGTVTTVNLDGSQPLSVATSSYFSFAYSPDENASELQIAGELAAAFRASVRRRSSPVTGRTVIALSGGLDSRMILSACPDGADIATVCFFDEENAETDIARRIARAKGVPFIPLQRRFEHYGESAAEGLRLSGGMASLASNHFLGFRQQIEELGAGSLLTGCYCDYLFKGLALNREVHRFSRLETPGSYSHDWYRPFFPLGDEAMATVNERLESVYPEELRSASHEDATLRLESRRMFPLFYEPDHTQRMIPHRVLPWYVPLADNDVVDVYLRTPVQMKMNATMFSRMVQIVCGPAVSAIPDSNTWAPLAASRTKVLFELYRRAFANKIATRVRPKLATTGSWPNWQYYVEHSEVLQRLWGTGTSRARVILTELIGSDPFGRPMDYWRGSRLELFLRLLTLKIWIDVRIA